MHTQKTKKVRNINLRSTFPINNIKDNQRLHIQAWGPQTYKIWWVSSWLYQLITAVDYIKTQYMTSSWACENNKKK